jgi:hypothetical protein
MINFMLGIVTWATVGIFVLALLLGSEQDNPEARVYCEMRKIFDDTGGEFGWPNYRNDIECINGEVK